MNKASILFIAMFSISTGTWAKIHRSHSAKAEFQRKTVCPATGKPEKHCKGHVVDHVRALACGGLDSPLNMQYQTVVAAKAKDKWELKECGR